LGGKVLETQRRALAYREEVMAGSDDIVLVGSEVDAQTQNSACVY